MAITNEQAEQYRDLLASLSKTRTADAATTDKLVLAVDALLDERNAPKGSLTFTEWLARRGDVQP